MDIQSKKTQSTNSMGHTGHWKKSILPGVMTLAIFGVIFTFVPIKETWETARRVSPWTILIVLAISTVFNSLVYSDRWRFALKHVGLKVGLMEILRVHLATGPIRLILPIQTGELATAAALARRSGSSTGMVFGTILYNKYLTLVATLILLAGGLFAGASMDGSVLRVTVGAGLAALCIFMAFEVRIMRRIFIRAASGTHAFLGELAKNLLTAYDKIPLAAKFKLVAYSLFFQFSEVVSCCLLFRDFGIDMPFGQLVVYVQLFVLITSLPISIAGAGTREGLALILLAPLSSPETAVACGLVYSFLEYLWPLVMGFPWTLSLGSKLWRQGNQPNDQA